MDKKLIADMLLKSVLPTARRMIADSDVELKEVNNAIRNEWQGKSLDDVIKWVEQERSRSLAKGMLFGSTKETDKVAYCARSSTFCELYTILVTVSETVPTEISKAV